MTKPLIKQSKILTLLFPISYELRPVEPPTGPPSCGQRGPCGVRRPSEQHAQWCKRSPRRRRPGRPRRVPFSRSQPPCPLQRRHCHATRNAARHDKRAFQLLTEAYPASWTSLLHSSGSMVSTRCPLGRHVSSTARFRAILIQCSILAKACSIDGVDGSCSRRRIAP